MSIENKLDFVETPIGLDSLLPQKDKLAKQIIFTVSAVVLLVVVGMGKFKPLIGVDYPFDRFIFAKINGVINSIVSVLLVVGLMQVKSKNYAAHKKSMLAAIILSSLFLVFYIIHHISNGDTYFGGNGNLKYIYYFLLITHIALASVILPFILLSAYYSLSGQFAKHKKLSRITWPMWLYVSVTGVIVFLFINPYYH
jgi:putative membrane protein